MIEDDCESCSRFRAGQILHWKRGGVGDTVGALHCMLLCRPILVPHLLQRARDTLVLPSRWPL
eukprot:7642788-Pyramimonas_sp.AAC.1